MITITHEEGNLIEVKIGDTLKAEDFKAFSAKVDEIIMAQETVRVLVDASDFNGWENMDAAEKHFGFVKAHHQKVEKIALVAGHRWQHWLAALVRVFIHPTVQVFDKGQVDNARTWLRSA